MDIKEYSENVENSRVALALKALDNIHMLFGMITEVGELADIFKKNMAYDREIDWVNVKEEVGDILWYIIGFCNINGFDFEDILETNIKKLQARYKNGFTKEEAENRNLEKERKILVNYSPTGVSVQIEGDGVAEWWKEQVKNNQKP